ncbi:MAG: sigma-70 family RNA polymerase sigma factor [Dehalococcoidia bacterium]|nr:sigma-70 family RNA polymerase sigma factor [Dehalococcoidia bacterium]
MPEIDSYIGRYGKRLYGLCMYLCADSHEADDLYQDTWVKVLDNISKYDTSKEFEPWLTRICVNTHRNVLRRIARSPIWNQFSSSEEKDLLIKSVPAPVPNDYSILHTAIKSLPQKLRVTIILFYFEDMDIASTAQSLGIPIGTVKSRLNKAKKLLREVLKHETDLQV